MDMKPPAMMKLGGGALLFIGTFFDWYGASEGGFSFGFSGTDIDFNGLQGIFALLIGLAIATVAGLRAFAPQVNIPAAVAGFAIDKLLFMLGIAVFLMCFGGLFLSAGPLGPKIGLFLCTIGAAIAVVGSFMDSKESSTAPATSY
jgi:hypothetical protein